MEKTFVLNIVKVLAGALVGAITVTIAIMTFLNSMIKERVEERLQNEDFMRSRFESSLWVSGLADAAQKSSSSIASKLLEGDNKEVIISMLIEEKEHFQGPKGEAASIIWQNVSNNKSHFKRECIYISVQNNNRSPDLIRLYNYVTANDIYWYDDISRRNIKYDNKDIMINSDNSTTTVELYRHCPEFS